MGNLDELNERAFQLEQKNLALETQLQEAEKQQRIAPRKRQQQLYAFSVQEDGYTEYMGPVVFEVDKSVRIQCYDAVMLFFGLVTDSGRLVDVPKERCRLFTDKESMHLAAAACMNR